MSRATIGGVGPLGVGLGFRAHLFKSRSCLALAEILFLMISLCILTMPHIALEEICNPASGIARRVRRAAFRPRAAKGRRGLR